MKVINLMIIWMKTILNNCPANEIFWINNSLLKKKTIVKYRFCLVHSLYLRMVSL